MTNTNYSTVITAQELFRDHKIYMLMPRYDKDGQLVYKDGEPAFYRKRNTLKKDAFIAKANSQSVGTHNYKLFQYSLDCLGIALNTLRAADVEGGKLQKDSM